MSLFYFAKNIIPYQFIEINIRHGRAISVTVGLVHNQDDLFRLLIDDKIQAFILQGIIDCYDKLKAGFLLFCVEFVTS